MDSESKLPYSHNSSRVELDFFTALDRLKNGCPKNKLLLERHKKGRLKITLSTVALEANHSRTLISKEDCAYPRVRSAISAHLQTSGSPTPRTAEELIKKLREENLALRSSLKKALSNNNALVLRINHLDKLLIRASSKKTRSENSSPEMKSSDDKMATAKTENVFSILPKNST